MSPGLKRTVAIALAAVFALLSAFHVVGALGAWTSLPIIPTVPGELAQWPSSLSWMGVAGALALAAVVVLTRGDLILRSLPPWLSTTACLVLGAVFVLRAIGEFRFLGFFKTIAGTDFAFWDTWLYTPLCLALGLGALWLASTPRTR